MKEYKVIDVEAILSDTLDRKINELAREGWRLISTIKSSPFSSWYRLTFERDK